MNVVKVKRARDAMWLWCEDCRRYLGCQYWSLAKSRGLHASGCPTHRTVMLAVAPAGEGFPPPLEAGDELEAGQS